MKNISYEFLLQIIKDAPHHAEGLRRVTDLILTGLNDKTLSPEQFSYRNLGLMMGMLDPYDLEGSCQQAMAQIDQHPLHTQNPNQLWSEANVTVTTNAFQTVTGALLRAKVIEGYEEYQDTFIGDDLVTVQPSRLRNARIPGLTALGYTAEVTEGMPYPETGFEDKYVTSKENKFGGILSITEEVILFDQTGSVNRKAVGMGNALRQDRERLIVNKVTDTDPTGNPVYRPNGTPEALYAADGSNKNYVGSGNSTDSGFSTNTLLTDWQDVDLVYKYRATCIKDDRVDGTPQPLVGLNNPRCILLVPEALRTTAQIIQKGSQYWLNTHVANNVASVQTGHANPVAGNIGAVKSSPHLDVVSVADWYYGDFKKQFLYTEIYPIQTFFQKGESNAQFERDVGLRVKVRFFGGVSALDTIYVTKVNGT